MPNYQLSKVYQIVCLTTGEKYIGSTTQKTLALRLAGHVRGFKSWKNGNQDFVSSYPIIERGNYQIELLEAYPCNSKDELNAREGHHIRTIDCVNKYVAGRTHQEYYEDHKTEIIERHKAYNEAHRTERAEHQKAYYQANKAEIAAYREAHKAEIAERHKAYREAHKAETAERNRAYNEAHKAEIAEYDKVYYEAHKAEIAERKKLYYQAHKRPKLQNDTV